MLYIVYVLYIHIIYYISYIYIFSQSHFVSLFYAQTVPRAPGQQALVLCKAGGVEARIAHIGAEDIVGEAWWKLKMDEV